MANLISSLFVKLTANTTGFETGMNKAERRVKSTVSQFDKATKSVVGLGKSLGLVVGAGMLTRLANDAIAAGSALTDMAEAAQTPVEELQALLYISRKAGAENQKMTDVLVRVQKSAADAARGLSTARDAFKLMGIDVETFINLSPERMLEELSKQLVKTDGDTRAYGAVMDILGTRAAPKLREALERLGTEGFDAVAEAARKAGQVMDEDTAQKLDAAADAVAEFKNAVTIHIGESIVFWARLGEEIAKVNKELHSNDSVSGGGTMADWFPKVEDVRTAEQQVELMGDLQKKYREVAAEMRKGQEGANSGTGFYTQEMNDELHGALVSLRLLMREVQKLQVGSVLDMDMASFVNEMNGGAAVSSEFAASIQSVLDGTGQLTLDLDAVIGSLEDTHDLIKDVPGFADHAASAVEGFGSALEDALVNASRDGKVAFADLAQYVLAEIQRILIRVMVLKPLFNMIGGFFGGTGTDLGSAFMNAFDGARAGGGPVSAGKSYLVGERGPEIVTMGGSGYVTPNGSFGGGAVYNIDARGADGPGLRRLELLIQQLNGSLEHRAIAAVGDMTRRTPNAFSRA